MDIDGRKKAFEKFVEERVPVLFEFGQTLGFEPIDFVQQPHLFVEPLDDWFADREITNGDRSWIHARIGYFIGEVFFSELGGAWEVCEREDSPFHGHYVVGQFNGSSAIVDPFGAADGLVNTPPPRSLATIIHEMKEALVNS